MPTEILSAGPLYTVTQNQIYALPPKRVMIFSSLAAQVSNDIAFGASQAVTANTPLETSAAYFRCTAGASLVTVRSV